MKKKISFDKITDINHAVKSAGHLEYVRNLINNTQDSTRTE